MMLYASLKTSRAVASLATRETVKDVRALVEETPRRSPAAAPGNIGRGIGTRAIAGDLGFGEHDQARSARLRERDAMAER